MKTRGENERVWAAWAREAREATPPVDTARGRERLLTAQRSLGQRARTRVRRRAWMVAASVAAVLAIGRLVWFRPLTFERAGVDAEPGAWLAADGVDELPLRFSEGTLVVLARDSRGRVDELQTRGARLVLERGALRANVTHRLRSDWRFVAGPFEVAVTGTSLKVGWDPVLERFSTSVTSGSVKVMGPSIGGEVVVHEGERCEVDLRRHTMQLSRLESAESPSLTLPSGSPVSQPAPPAAVPLPAKPDPVPLKRARANGPTVEADQRWTHLEQAGRYDAAFAAVERAGVEATIASASDDELLRLARLARAMGDAAIEQQSLMGCRARFAHTPSAAIAAYELGRASAPDRAAQWFAIYLDEQPAGALAEQASGRLVEALELAGRHAEAAVAARKTLARFPDGPYASLARRVIGSPPK
jgi:hypothetical protein